MRQMQICLGQQLNLLHICHRRLMSTSPSPERGAALQAQAGLTGYQTVPAQLCSSSGGPVGLWVSTNVASTAHSCANHVFGPLTPCTLPSSLQQHPAPRGSLPAQPLWQNLLVWFRHREFNSCYAQQGTAEKLQRTVVSMISLNLWFWPTL